MQAKSGASSGTPTTETPVTSGSVSSVTQRYRDTDTHEKQETQEPQRNKGTTLSPLSQGLKNQSISISEVVDHALAVNERFEVSTDPDHYLDYHTPLWDFTKAVKGFFVDGTDPELVFDFIEDEITNRGGWTILELPIEEDEIYERFIYTWDRIKFSGDQNLLAVANDLAQETPLEAERSGRRSGALTGYSEFVSVAGWAQVLRGDQPIYLPCKLVAALLNTNTMRVTRWRSLAIKHGYLEIVAEHSLEKKKATEFRFNVSRFPELSQGDKASKE
jgi:hypothetical protein